MKFYSGFTFKNDENYFKEYINHSEYSVSGFSYGAIKAFEYVKEQVEKGVRVDSLQLFSPAFFQTKSEKFKRLQTFSFKKDKEGYINSFIHQCFTPYSIKSLDYEEANIIDLSKLLNYKWLLKELLYLENKNIKIEVYLGGQDKVIDVESAREFFLEVATVTYIKDANHFLQTN